MLREAKAHLATMEEELPGIKRRRVGEVAGLYIGDTKNAAKKPVTSLVLSFGGIAGDAHAGGTRKAGAREPAFKRGLTIVNMRQVSLVSLEELEIIAAGMGISALDPGWLAANIATVGAGSITQMPCGTIICFPSGASLYVTELNSPCRSAAAIIEREGQISKDAASQFVRHARGRRGLVARVYSEGIVRVGDGLDFLLSKPELAE